MNTWQKTEAWQNHLRLLVLIAFLLLAAALLVLEADRSLGAHVFDAANGGPILWQHLFWFFGHPEVCIIALPFFGIVTEVLPVFSRKPVFGYIGLVAATLMIGVLSVSVWAHHMYATGAVSLPFFSLMSFLIAVPTGVKFFNWIGTMWGGNISMHTPNAVGGRIHDHIPLRRHDRRDLGQRAAGFPGHRLFCFVVAHFHYVVFGTVVFAMFAGYYSWWPKFTGRMLDETLGKIHFWMLFIGFLAGLIFRTRHVRRIRPTFSCSSPISPDDTFVAPGNSLLTPDGDLTMAARCCCRGPMSGR